VLTLKESWYRAQEPRQNPQEAVALAPWVDGAGAPGSNNGIRGAVLPQPREVVAQGTKSRQRPREAVVLATRGRGTGLRAETGPGGAVY
jgi:hypothetical protein